MIVINPSVQTPPSGIRNAKGYPYWTELVPLLDDEIIQIGIPTDTQLVNRFIPNMPFKVIKELLKECKYWITTDSFLPHLAHHIPKSGVVIFGPSDPKIYGYEENLNILKDRSYLRHDQFGTWDQCIFNADRFESAIIVANKIKEWASNEFKTSFNDRQ